MCGIFGASLKSNVTKNDMRIALQKFKILGLYNESRGKDSCGVYINDVVKKGTGTKKLFSAFIEYETFELSTKNRIFLGHNRQASFGYQITEANQHPFLVADDLLITHNGTIKETLALCTKYGVSWSDFTVDTEMLANAFYYNGTQVLENYKGAAALAYTYKSKPNALYLYHGSSATLKDKAPEEERPLFYMETKEGIYYSSLESALDAIREHDYEIALQVAHNSIIEIIDGQFTDQDVAIERGDINVEIPKVYSGFSGGSSYHTRGYHGQGSHVPFRPGANASKKTTAEISNLMSTRKIPVTTEGHIHPILSVKRESLPSRLMTEKKESFLYYFRARHWINNPNGLNTLADGRIFVMKKRGYVVDSLMEEKANLCYFWKGYMLKDNDALLVLEERYSNKGEFTLSNVNIGLELSNMTMFPAMDPDLIGLTIYKWYFNGKLVTDAFTPKFSGRSYVIKAGFLTEIKSSHKNEKCYYNTVSEAEAEMQAYLTGAEIIKTSSVAVDAETDLGNPPKQSSEFYNKIYENYSDVQRTMGRFEIDALDKFSAWYLDNDTPFRADLEDAKAHSAVLIRDAIANGIAIEEVIFDGAGGQEGVNKLIAFYEEIQDDESHAVDYAIAEAYLTGDDNEVDKKIMGFMKLIKPETEDQDINKITELTYEIFQALDDIHEAAQEFENAENCETSKNVAEELYSMIDNFRLKASGSELLSETEEFMQFEEKMKDFGKVKKNKHGIV